MFTFKSGYLLIFFIFSVKRFAPFGCLYSSRFNCFLLFSEKRHTSNSNRVKALLNSLFHTVLFHKREQIMGCEEHFQTFYRASDHTGFCFEKHLVSSDFGRWNIVFFVLKLTPYFKRSICVMQSTERRSVSFAVWGLRELLFLLEFCEEQLPRCIILMYQHKRALLWRWRLKWGREKGKTRRPWL